MNKNNNFEYNFIGELMINKINNIKSIVLPNKKINFFAICLIVLGVIIGSIFSNIVGLNDKNLIIDKIKLFIDNIDNNNLNSILSFKNSISINLIYIIIIWIFGMTLIGIPFCIFLLFFKSFVLGFSISAFILTYGYKGIILGILYLLFGQLINIFVLMILTIYGIMFSFKLIKLIFKNNNSNIIAKFLKNYCLILVITILFSILSSVLETFLLPALIKLIIKLFV